MNLVLMGLFAQNTEKFYDFKWEECPLNEARFYRLIAKTDSGYLTNDFYIKEDRIQMIGLFSDSLCKVKNGSFQFYHPNGIISGSEKYINNKEEGLFLRFHSNGILKDSIVYSNGNKIGNSLSWYPNGNLSDSTSLNKDRSGVSVFRFDNGTLSAEGMYSADMKQNGKWQYFHKNGNVSSIEIYDQSKLLSKQYFTEKGELINDTTNTDRDPQFKGGEDAWLKYLEKKIYYPRHYRIVNGDQAVVVVIFTVNEDGNVEDVSVRSLFNRLFDTIAVNAIKKSPKWLPAISHNRCVKRTCEQIVRFKNN